MFLLPWLNSAFSPGGMFIGLRVFLGVSNDYIDDVNDDDIDGDDNTRKQHFDRYEKKVSGRAS